MECKVCLANIICGESGRPGVGCKEFNCRLKAERRKTVRAKRPVQQPLCASGDCQMPPTCWQCSQWNKHIFCNIGAAGHGDVKCRRHFTKR